MISPINFRSNTPVISGKSTPIQGPVSKKIYVVVINFFQKIFCYWIPLACNSRLRSMVNLFPKDLSWEKVLSLSRQLALYDAKCIAAAINSIPSPQRFEVATHTATLFSSLKECEMRQDAIISAIFSIPAEERANVVNLVLRLQTSHMQNFDRVKLINAIAIIPIEERESVIQLASPLFVDTLCGIDRPKLIEAIARISFECRNTVLETAKSLFGKDLKDLNRSHIIDAVGKILFTDESACILDSANFIFKNNPRMNCIDRARIIEALTAISQEEQSDFARCRETFFPNADLSDEGASHVLIALFKVPVAERSEVFKEANTLFSRRMDNLAKSHIISTITSIPVDQRTIIIENAKRKVNKDPKSDIANWHMLFDDAVKEGLKK